MRVYETGNKNFKVTEVEYNTDGSVKYTKELTSIQGLVSVDLSLEQTSESIAADDDINYITLSGALTGSGTVTFIHLSEEGYQALYNNVTDKNSALVFGQKGAPKKVAFVFENTVNNDDGTTSTNRITFYNAVFTLPSVSTTTVADGETARREFPISVTVNPAKFTVDLEEKTATFSIVNSTKNADAFTKTASKIYTPDMELGE